MPFSQIIPPSPSPSESKSPLYTSVSFLLSCIQGRHQAFFICGKQGLLSSWSVVASLVAEREL